jgi:glycosyltransferase involved in cell wall biosynthesis
METQDSAVSRGWLKSVLRGLVYRAAYSACRHFFFIGELNRRHYVAHGASADRMSPARYCVPDALAALSTEDKLRERNALRQRLGFGPSDCVVGFFGKLIPKKDPALLIAAWKLLPPALQARLKPMFVGDGELRQELEQQARAAGVPAVFAGFINQRELPNYYLAADIAVLPSRRMGETWGLVVNEALLAGCGVVVTEAVGCGTEFAGLDRVRIVPIESAAATATAFAELAARPRDFDWARPTMADYSIEAAARGLAAALPAI